MKQFVKLPFSDSPIFTIYNNYGFITGIIQGNSNNSFEPWAYGRFINCAFNPGFGFRVFGTPDMLDATKGLVCEVKSIQFPRAQWMEYWKSLLGDGIYINANIDEQYIPGKWAYNVKKYYHDSLVMAVLYPRYGIYTCRYFKLRVWAGAFSRNASDGCGWFYHFLASPHRDVVHCRS